MLCDHSSSDAVVPDTSKACCFRQLGDRQDIQKVLLSSSFFVVCTCTRLHSYSSRGKINISTTLCYS
ncbi:hypothetical protein DAI22_11g188800 [Oryza sativa Japonica Group]|nr:hypothetical protein DAI22_11g188800 [Oryza sativa Japonica Group]